MTDKHDIVDIMAGEISPGVEGWSIITRRPDGTRWQHTFPRTILEWRAAEYGLTDPAEILDVVLHEPHVDAETPAPPPSVTAPPAPAIRPAMSAARPPSLTEATSTSEARGAHRTRIEQVKTGKVHITDPKGLLRHIWENHGMDPDGVRTKQEAVDVHRWTKLYGGLPVPAPTKEA